MRPNFQIASLVPNGLAVKNVSTDAQTMLFTARAANNGAGCPVCGLHPRRVHNRYIRRVSGLPCSGQRVWLRQVTRRLFCDARECHRQIFSERFGKPARPTRARKTARLDHIVHHLGLALGSHPWLEGRRLPAAAKLSRKTPSIP
jgi:transposase